jgi:3-deoxy-D-manno-octulosonic-acid transferase
LTRLEAYRGFQRRFVKRFVLPRVMSAERISEAERGGLANAPVARRSAGRRRFWFHGASVGELESLWGVAQASARSGDEVIVTVLSESARSAVQRLGEALQELPGQLLFQGYSPWEGEWEAALKQMRPDAFVTAKYEAWPELWAGLRRTGTPLVVVGASARTSLRVASWASRLLGGEPPELMLLTARDDDKQGLKRLFPRAHLETVGEPRWDRVFERARTGNPVAAKRLKDFGNSPRPWWLLGSVGQRDLDFLEDAIRGWSGTLWVVPHRVDPGSIERFEEALEGMGLVPMRSSGGAVASEECVLVDEVGFLLELYAAADHAYVGGGFGKGIHSTIEPAIFGIPVSCGPEGTRKFPEAAELQGTGQLRILRRPEEASAWLGDPLGARAGAELRMRWIEEAKGRLGATERVLRRAHELAQARASC